MGAFLLGLGLAVYGPHIDRGGFVHDDWAYRADYERWGYWGAIQHWLDPGVSSAQLGVLSRRPVAAAFYATTHAVFGSTTSLHLALAALLGVLMSFLLFLVLRTLGMERLHAALIAALVLVFPAADAARLWSAASQSELAISLYLLGMLLALNGLQRSGRQAVLVHAGAVGCYVLAVFCYEIVVAGVALSFLVYRVRVSWSLAARRWLADVAALGLAVAYSRFVAAPADFGPLSSWFDTAWTIQGQARTLLSQLGIQDGQAWVDLKVLALVLAAAAVLALFLPRTDELRSDLRRWLVVALAGALAVAAGYVALLPIQGRLPLHLGFGNRVNIGAAAGYVVLIYALAILLGTMVVRALSAVRTVRNPRAWAAGFGAAVAVAVGFLWIDTVVADRRAWDRAESIRSQTLATLRELPRPAPGSTIYMFGVPGETAPGVPTFSAFWDLTGAVRLLWDDHTLTGIASPTLERDYPGQPPDDWGLTCTESSVQPGGYSAEVASPYGRTIFVHIPSRAYVMIRDRRGCQAAVTRYFRTT